MVFYFNDLGPSFPCIHAIVPSCFLSPSDSIQTLSSSSDQEMWCLGLSSLLHLSSHSCTSHTQSEVALEHSHPLNPEKDKNSQNTETSALKYQSDRQWTLLYWLSSSENVAVMVAVCSSLLEWLRQLFLWSCCCWELLLEPLVYLQEIINSTLTKYCISHGTLVLRIHILPCSAIPSIADGSTFRKIPSLVLAPLSRLAESLRNLKQNATRLLYHCSTTLGHALGIYAGKLTHCRDPFDP